MKLRRYPPVRSWPDGCLAALAALCLHSGCVLVISLERPPVPDGVALAQSAGGGGNAGMGGDSVGESVAGAGGAGASSGTPCTAASVVSVCGVDTGCRSFWCVEGSCSVEASAVGTPCRDDNGTSCDGLGNCAEAHCANGVRDADEVGVDCGGVTCTTCDG